MKKLRWAILALSVVLCVVIFFSWDKIASSKNNESVENNAIGSETYVSGENYFESARYSRDQVRSSELESKIESLVKAKGFSDCVAFVGEDNVSIVVENVLSSEDAAKIIDIAIGETGFPSSVVKIIELDSESEETSAENSQKD